MIDKIDSWVLSPNRQVAIDTEELTALELIGRTAKKTNDLVDELNNTNNTVNGKLSKKEYLEDIREVRKISDKGNFTGSWHGIERPEYAEPGIAGVVKKHTDQIEEMNLIVLDSDIDGTAYKQGDIIDRNWLITQQAKNYSYQMKKLHEGNAVNILCRGDSLTYGYDIESQDKIPPSETPTDKGKAHTRERAKTNYPMALEEYLNSMGCNVTVENIGYSGAWVKFSYDEYYKARTNRLEIIMLGTNDSRLDSCPYKGDVKAFIDYYEQLIIREILWGNGLILVQPIITKYMKDQNIESFRTAVKIIAEKYKIPCIDGSELMSNYKYDIWSDNTHFNKTGYRILGSKFASAIGIQDFTMPKKIGHSDVLSIRPTLDSCRYLEGTRFSLTTTGYTPESTDKDTRLVARLDEANSKIVYTFYAKQDNLVLLPTIFIPIGGSVKFQLDHGLQQGQAPLTTVDYKYSEWTGDSPTEWIITNDRSSNYTYSKITSGSTWSDEGKRPLYINNKGWYTLTVEALTKDPSYSINLFGIEFMSAENWYNIYGRHKYKTIYKSAISGGDYAVGTNIKLSESMENFDFLIFNYNFLGTSQQLVDYKLSSTLEIRSPNLGNSSDDLNLVVNEFAIEKVDENNIQIVRNKTIQYKDSPLVPELKDTSTWLGKLIGIVGVKL